MYLPGRGMGKAIIFIETPMFTRQIKQIATDDELKELQKNSSELPIKVISFSRLVDCVKSEWLRVHRKKWQCQNNLLSGDGRDYLFDYGLSDKCQR